jgi:hypothetical protein
MSALNTRVILIASGILAILFGLFFLVGAEGAIGSYGLGESTLPARLFARATGAGLISIGIINILASGDRGSPALRAIVIGNIVIHVLSLGVDFSESYAKSAGIWVGLAVHVIFIVAFGYMLINWNRLTKA